ncbi:MAG: DUF1302 domain-containing protein [Verrucomicrobia bacterium]|nr:DUF1302 domain-containing protein [Verrucomicrobiota bacterium]
MKNSSIYSWSTGSGIVFILLLFLTTSTTIHAFSFEVGELNAQLDTTFSIGGSYRTSNPDPDFFGLPNGGNQFSINLDDGNLNYEKGWFSKAVKMTNDFELSGDSAGVFVRLTSFYDWENKGGVRSFRPLGKEALDKVGSDSEFLDAFVYFNIDAGDIPIDLRFGSQVLSWGESIFIQNGINSINPVDVSKLRIPGAELKEALKPVPMVSFNIGLTENITLEGFYQLRWQETIIDPRGTYFSTNDVVSRGSDKIYLGFGAIPEDAPFGFVPRGKNVEASDSNQYGLAMRFLVPSLNDTEFGLYLIKYHSRTPLVSAITPTQHINPDLSGPLTQVFLLAGMAPEMAAQQAAGLWGLATVVQTYGPGAVPPEQLAILTSPESQGALEAAGQFAFFEAAATARYQVEYPEEITLYGASFNTDIGNSGWTLQGELSYRPDQPMALDDVETLYAALSAINPDFGLINGFGNYFGRLGERIQGYREKDMYQFQISTIRAFGPTLGADQMIFVAEAGYTSVPGLSDTGIPFDGPGTITSADPLATAFGIQPVTEPLSAFATSSSWGYRAVVQLDYSDVWHGINVSPLLQFAHDVNGITPNPILNFREGRKSMTLGLLFDYQSSWSSELLYTKFSGAGRYNLLSDRDFITTSLKYSF